MSKVYVEQDKLLDAVQLLGNISDPAIAREIEALRPAAPTADEEPGVVRQYIDVHLSSNADTVYYTTDG